MGTCLSKKKGSSTTAPAVFEPSGNGVTVSNSKVETEQEVKLKKENRKAQEKHESVVVQEDKGQVKKEIFIIKHRKSHDDRERNSKGISAEQNAPQSGGGGTAKIEATLELMGVRTSSCTKEEVDAILIHCGRLSRNSSGKYRFSGSKRSHDFDNCDNDTISTEEEYQKKANATDNNGLMEDASEKRHRQSPRSVSKDGGRRRRRTPSREREEKQRSSSRERRVSRSPVRRSSDTTTTPANARNNNTNITSSKPGKMVSVPATVSSLVMDKSNNNGGGGGGGGGESAGIKRITVRRNVGAASPRSQSPARASGNAANGNKVLSENQQQPSLGRNNSRKAEQSPYRRNPLSEVEPNSLSFPHSTTNNNNSRVQNRPKKEVETEANQKPNASRIALDKGVGVNCKTKVQQEEDVKVQSSMTDNVVVMTVVPPIVDNLKPQTLTRSRSSRRSRDLDLNPEALFIPPQSYTSLLLEDIQNFHQKNTPPVSLPACVTRACSILEAVADLNSNTSSNFSGRNQYNVPLGTTTNDHLKRVPDTKDPIVESELVVYDDVMEPSLHKYVTVNRGGSDMEDQESSGSNGFTVSSGKQWRGISSSSWEPSSTDSKDCWTSRLNNCREEGQKSQLGLEGRVSSEAGRAVDGAKEKLNSKSREFDHQHDSGRLGGNNVLHTKPVVTGTAAASKYR